MPAKNAIPCHQCGGPLVIKQNTDTGFDHLFNHDASRCDNPIPAAVLEATRNKLHQLEEQYLAEIEHLVHVHRQVLADFQWSLTVCVPVKGTANDMITHFWELVEQYLL